jgi:hypothetical protein
MSRVLKNGNNQITQSYQAHYNKVKSGLGWAIGTDVVKYKNQLDYVVAHSEGTVLKVVNYLDGTNKQLDNEGMGYGNYVMILHNNNIVTLYAHLTKVTVKQGQKVAKGTALAFMGNTGNSSGAHLHFEVRQYKSAPTAATLHDSTKFEFLNSEKYLDADLPANATNIKAIGFLDTAKCSGTILTCSGWAYKGAGGQVVTIKIFDGSKEVKKFDIRQTYLELDYMSFHFKYENNKVYCYDPDDSSVPTTEETLEIIDKTLSIRNKYASKADDVINIDKDYSELYMNAMNYAFGGNM